jgi:hypothetical protein
MKVFRITTGERVAIAGVKPTTQRNEQLESEDEAMSEDFLKVQKTTAQRVQ